VASAPPVAEPKRALADGPRPAYASAARSGYRILTLAPTPFFGDYGCHVRILEEMRALREAGHRPLLATYPYGRSLPELPIRRPPRPPGRWHARPGTSRH